MSHGADTFTFTCPCGYEGYIYDTEKDCNMAREYHRSLCNGKAPKMLPKEEKKASDDVNHPSHYQGKVETIDAIESACAGIGPDAFKGYLTGNIVKYMSRWSRKGGAQDLRKAAWYLAKLLDVVKP